MKKKILCDYGCGQKATHQFKNGKRCCSRNISFCPIIKRKKEGKINYWLGKKMPPFSEEHRKNLSKSLLGKKSWNEGLTSGTDYRVKKNGDNIKRAWDKNIKEKKRRSIWMKNGHAVHMNSCLTNPSREQVELNKLVSRICPYVYLNYPVYRGKRKKNYSIDIAVPKLNLAVEYDGYWHFNSEERKKQDNQRQKEIEEEGWKFLRYNIYQSFPTLEQVKKDIFKAVKK